MIDLHIHSKYSFDSLLSPRTILKVAKKKGLTGIAVTDHNTIRGGLEVRKINKDRDFTVIVGSEIQTDIGDIIGLCVNEEIKSRISIEVIEEIKDQGGYVVLPHPFRGHKLNQYIIELSDAVEVFNGRSTAEENFKALELAKRYNKPFTAGSDAHFAAEIGYTHMMINVHSLKDIKSEAIFDSKELQGQQCPRYLVDASQAIKSLKRMEYLQSTQHMLYFLYHMFKDST
ncbi:MAG TPA: PHP domain-containing protein [Fervidobacterium sp.]|nr:PHP domain-containing protein [Fervidobacterium sp.]